VGVQKVIVPSLEPEEAERLSPLVLAYVGDAVYELYVRGSLLRQGHGPGGLHAACVRWVSAVGQERVWLAMEPALTETEARIARRGRNAKGIVPQGVGPGTYRRSTALEALVGYLYLTGQEERLVSLLSQAFAAVEEGSV